MGRSEGGSGGWRLSRWLALPRCTKRTLSPTRPTPASLLPLPSPPPAPAGTTHMQYFAKVTRMVEACTVYSKAKSRCTDTPEARVLDREK